MTSAVTSRCGLCLPRDSFLDHALVRLHYLDWGNEGAAVMLLLHGFTSHARSWDFFATAFQEDYRILALDQRGHGESSWALDGAYSLEDHLADIATFAEALELNAITMIGHSMGGRNAILFAACYPELVQRLILVDSRPDASGSAEVRAMQERLPDKVDSLDEAVAVLKDLYPHLSLDMARHLVSYGFHELPGGGFVAKYDKIIRCQAQGVGYHVSALWPFLNLIQCPTLIIRGEESPVLSREAALRMRSAISGSQLVEVERAGHLPPWENPPAFEAAVRGFLE